MYPVDVLKELTYAVVDGEPLTLDLYRPRVDADVPVVLYLHGGAYRAGDKRDNETRPRGLAAHGVAVASANYRLVPQATYPAQIHDAKAAIRWLRATGTKHGLAIVHTGVWGASAGGYLASMLGLTAGDADLEGRIGDHLAESSAVQAVVTWFAPSDLIAQSRRTWLEELALDDPAEKGLFARDRIAGDDAFVRHASPLERAHAKAPAFLIASGDRDRIVAEHQGRALHDVLARNAVDVTYTVLGGAGHEDPRFDAPAHLAGTAAWLHRHLEPGGRSEATEPEGSTP